MTTVETPASETEYGGTAKKWQLAVASNDALGDSLIANVPIPKGEIAMILPPNLLLSHSEVDVKSARGFNAAVQVAEDLFSMSLADDDLDNYIAHNCEPNCRIEIKEDYTVHLVANRDIPAQEPLAFDYESTEWDMVSQGVDFTCNCGSTCCRKHIIGWKRRQQLQSDAEWSVLIAG
mmetsp:Transcript_21190/g.49737  ORF Transcript_21190/g.49737 Transcript_21190/m.49737 type:complete len:177 (+) Transcript_21190:48-578(+)